MSVTTVTPISAGAGGTASGNDGGTVAMSYNAAFRVTCSSARDTAQTVLKHFRLNADYPWPGRSYKFGDDFDATAIAKTVDAKYIDSSEGKFLVQCTFGPLNGDQQQNQGQTASGGNSTDPLKWHDEISVGYTQISVPTEAAIFKGFTKLGVNNPAFTAGKEMALMNSACKPFDPTIEEEVDVKVIRITRNVAAYDDTILDKYQGAINSDVVTINKPKYRFKTSFGIYHGRIKALTADFAVTNGIPYYKHTVEVHVYPKGRYGWLRLILDQGIEELWKPGDVRPDGLTLSDSDFPRNRQFEVKMITDEEGLPITSPVRLDGNGKMLKPEDDPVFSIWQTKKLLPFATIPW